MKRAAFSALPIDGHSQQALADYLGISPAAGETPSR